jgi:hypothetical protein
MKTTKTRPMKIRVISFLFAATSVAFSQSDSSEKAPLGLSRLETNSGVPSKGNPQASRFETDELVATGVPGATKSRKGKQDVVVLAGEATYARPLRAKKGEYGFVSFAALGSLGSVIEIAGAKVGISESSAVSGYASIMVKGSNSDWQSTQLSVPFNSYEGNRFATMPVITVRLDPEAGEFDVYASSRLLVEGIPLEFRPNDRKFSITAGSGGAWLMGLVQSDINPLYVDENENGVDDDFELASNGELQSRGASKQQRKDLIRSWQKTERFAPPPALFVSRPRPD